jgi:hypothetical protein
MSRRTSNVSGDQLAARNASVSKFFDTYGSDDGITSQQVEMLLSETNQMSPPLTATKLTMLFTSVKLGKKKTLNRDLFEELLRKISVVREVFFTELCEVIQQNWPQLAEGDHVLSGSWAARLDPSSGEEYYINRATAQSTWDFPEELRDTSSQWEEMVDPASGQTYYFNSTTGETSWDKPGAVEETEVTSTGTSAWRECEDPSSGQVYFYNSDTHETTWERPAEMDAVHVHQHTPKVEMSDSEEVKKEEKKEEKEELKEQEREKDTHNAVSQRLSNLKKGTKRDEGGGGGGGGRKGVGALKDLHKEDHHSPRLKRAEMEQLRSSKKMSSWKTITLQLNKKNSKVLKMKDKKDGVGIDKTHEEFVLIDVQDCSAFPGNQFHVIVLDGRRRKTLKFRVESEKEATEWVDAINFNVAWNMKNMAPSQ